MFDRVRDFRRRQRDRLRESNRPLIAWDPEPDDEQLTHDLLGDVLPRADGDRAAGDRAAAARRQYGQAGRPLNRQSPFYVGFVGAIGVLTAYGLWQAVSSLDTVITLLVVSFFLTLALNPVVEVLVRRGMSRGPSVPPNLRTACGGYRRPVPSTPAGAPRRPALYR